MRIEQRPALAETFLVHAKLKSHPPEDLSALDRLLLQTWETAREPWPTVPLPAEPFVAYLARRLPEVSLQEPLEPLLEKLSLTDLYLACACMRGVLSAIKLFESHYLAKLPGRLRGARQPEAMIDDVCQLTRVKLLVPTPEGSPKLTEYEGRGGLLGFMWVTALRISNKLQAVEKPSADEEAEALFAALPAPGVDTELDLIKKRHHADFRQAVREAFGVLSDHERHLFRLYYIDQLSMYELASLFRVNQSTISRWLQPARQRIYEETKRRLQARLGLSSEDFKSFLAALDSQFELGISQLLREQDSVLRHGRVD